MEANAEVQVRPLADGGEGTVEALVAGMNGKTEHVKVTGPLGEPVICEYGIIESTKNSSYRDGRSRRNHTGSG